MAENENENDGLGGNEWISTRMISIRQRMWCCVVCGSFEGKGTIDWLIRTRMHALAEEKKSKGKERPQPSNRQLANLPARVTSLPPPSRVSPRIKNTPISIPSSHSQTCSLLAPSYSHRISTPPSYHPFLPFHSPLSQSGVAQAPTSPSPQLCGGVSGSSIQPSPGSHN